MQRKKTSHPTRSHRFCFPRSLFIASLNWTTWAAVRSRRLSASWTGFSSLLTPSNRPAAVRPRETKNSGATFISFSSAFSRV